jgi:ribulose-5-phosphate 4-epimerase/fuculose-1-phosphate aldolase
LTYVVGDLRDQLALVGHAVVQAGLVVGSGGNLSARAPGTDECWVTAAGTWLDRLNRPSFVRVRISDGVLMDAAGRAYHPAEPVARPACGAGPTSELGLHLATYRVRPDVNAVVHLHPQTVLLLDALAQPIRLISTDHAFYLRRIATAPFHPPGTPAVGESAARVCADGTNCVVLSRHGCSVLGPTVELAHKRAMYLEEAALLTYRALRTGRIDDLTDCPTDWLDDSGSSSA